MNTVLIFQHNSKGINAAVKRTIAFALAAFVSLSLVSCSESELLEGEELLPDLNTAYFTDDNGRVRWPEEILPMGFPIPAYEEIYSVERKDNVVTITVFSRFILSPAKIVMPNSDFTHELLTSGYINYLPPGGDGNDHWGTYYNKTDHTRVAFYTSQIGQDHFSEHLQSINSKSPTNFTMQIIVDKYDLQPESLLWTYPDRNTDLGLENIRFDEWPEEYLPDDIKIPGEGIEILSMEQKSNGVFITVRGEFGKIQRYDFGASYGSINILEGNTGHRMYINNNGDYFFIEETSSGGNSVDSPIYITRIYQVCKFNEYVIKDS